MVARAVVTVQQFKGVVVRQARCWAV